MSLSGGWWSTSSSLLTRLQPWAWTYVTSCLPSAHRPDEDIFRFTNPHLCCGYTEIIGIWGKGFCNCPSGVFFSYSISALMGNYGQNSKLTKYWIETEQKKGQLHSSDDKLTWWLFFLLVLITLVWHVYSQLFGFIITCYPKVAGAWAQGTHFRRLRSICVVRSSPSRKPEGPRQLKLSCSTHLPSTRKLFVWIWSFHLKSFAFQLLKALLSPPRHNEGS